MAGQTDVQPCQREQDTDARSNRRLRRKIAKILEAFTGNSKTKNSEFKKKNKTIYNREYQQKTEAKVSHPEA